MADPTPAPAGGEDPIVNIHSAAPSQQPESGTSEVSEPSQDAGEIATLEQDIKRDHLPHIGATG